MEDLTGKQLGQYQIVARLGVGGMATVFKAYQPRMDRYVALKILPRHFSDNPEFISRFSQEARLIAQLEHPHILPVYDFGESDGYTYLAMRLVEGGPLSNLLKKHGKLELTKINHIVTQVGGALDYAHKRGVIHRDFKPGNVLIDEFGNCLLTDFGIAKIVETTSNLTHTGGILGTPSYISPEQGSGKSIDTRSDIYSLGVVLYQMVVGGVPYQADTPMAVVYMHIHDPLPLPRQLSPDLPEPIERVILKALAKNPDARYATATELVNALQNAIDQPTFQIQEIQESVHEPDPTIIAGETPTDPEELPTALSAKPIPGSDEIKKIEEKKKLPEQKEEFRTGHRWVYGVLVIFLLALLAGAGWLYYNSVFLSEHILRVDTNPAGADVYLDGGHVGVSPVQLENLTPGEHRVRASKDRYEDYIENLFIQEGKSRVIKAELTLKPFGDLKVDSNPSGAEVFIDDDQKGTTPIALENLPKGTRKVMLKKKGFDSWQGTVEIVPLEKAHVSAELAAIYGSLKVISEPNGAEVLIGGKSVGKAPLMIEKVKKGKTNVEARKACFAMTKKAVTILAGQETNVRFELENVCGSIAVDSKPTEAMWYLDGKQMGITPGKIGNVKKGEHQVKIVKGNYDDWSGKVQVKVGETESVFADLIFSVVDSKGYFNKYRSGVVRDTKTGLEWYAGPDKDTNWDKTKKWVKSLNVAGGGWRMPTRNELTTLYEKGESTRNMTPLLKTTGWFVWSGETKGSSSAWLFGFYNGNELWRSQDSSGNGRGFAVRSRK